MKGCAKPRWCGERGFSVSARSCRCAPPSPLCLPAHPSPSRPARPAPRGSAEGGGRPGRAEEKEAAPVLPARRRRASPQLGRGGSRARARGARTAPHRTDLPAAPEMRRVCTLPLWLWLGIVSEAGELPGLPCPLRCPFRTCGRAGAGAAPAGRDGTRSLRPRVPESPQGPALPAAAPSPRTGLCRALRCPSRAPHPRLGPAPPSRSPGPQSPPGTGAARPIPGPNAPRCPPGCPRRR